MSLNLKFGERHTIMCFGIQNSFEASSNMHSGEVPYNLDSVSVSVTNRQEWKIGSSKCALLTELKHDRKFVCGWDISFQFDSATS